MKIKFYLKRPGAASETSIFAILSYEGNTIKIYTGESIVPKYWNPDTQAARTTPKFPESPEFNQRLNNIRGDISRVFLDYRNKHNHASPSPAVLKPLIETALKKGVKANGFLSYYEDFVTRSMMGKRIDPRSRKPVGTGVTRGYKTTLLHLQNFDRISKRKIDFSTIDLEFHQDFTNYLSSPPLLLSANTIGSHFQRIKCVMAEATEKGINANMAFKSRYFIKQSEDAETIYLDVQELKEMGGLDLSDNRRLDNVRDSFLIGAFTGLRFSDFSILKSENIKDGFIHITQTKTGKPVIIPVHYIVNKILKKRHGNPPPAISNVKMNEYLKEIGQLLPSLAKTESKTMTKGGVKITMNYQKWELLSTHTARRSFATNEYKQGTPTLTIMAITGHKTEKSFLKYIRVTLDEHAQTIKQIWDKRGRKDRLRAV